MAVQRINRLIRKMDMKQVNAELTSPMRAETNPGVFVCEVSLADWTRYVKCEHHVLMSRAMAWHDGKIYIVELPGWIHESFSRSLDFAVISATGTGEEHLLSCGSTYVDALAPIEPDSSFGPARGFGATLPHGMTWGEYHTLKVEVGVTRGWPCLDERAMQWSAFPGVEYILLIRLSPDLQVHQYKLHAVVDGTIVPTVAIPIVNPTNVVLESRRLLGLPALAPIPAHFTAPPSNH
ncbi:hypothetical protein H310_06983 [Aphanomyces invadans]|uniref:Uncharacterized protein n=1 Tax=Aphanomyces invadans TaxID=157072 RepID=A0A024U6H3_9STRA|nr:hypothetical protein H310_06983 [Aphanomyces invadans]ETW01472.1 hypothetical protein H310_06983 [Aphanomyces invadans]|eukprot:XP_008870470.1 hypothetical protein H310_06983 [Aphanomyces invadans]